MLPEEVMTKRWEYCAEKHADKNDFALCIMSYAKPGVLKIPQHLIIKELNLVLP